MSSLARRATPQRIWNIFLALQIHLAPAKANLPSMNYNPAALTTCTLEKEETYSQICVELTTTSDEHQLTHYWALLERALTAPPFSGKSGLSQLSLVTPTAFTHTLTNPPNLCCWLSMHESFCINKASVLTAFTSHHTQDIMAERQNISKVVPIICRIQNNQFQVKPNNL